ncbi:DUF4838 domain-containing protein [Arenibacter algicola]|uniref:F5/8 type C domain-containing protein n=1 Tax=Arenibacter algicola TaxID=616991 RepID=A0A221UYG3_9FLAO|nr:DUF4838 domain-containing protein [Arenibacter algicola]ASO06395.1 hypothetical protein AREALGSMS7_02962 [Arenibacter algicola]HCO83027.1 DUF4838 domain-containing protein [Arenibacter sp.]
MKIFKSNFRILSLLIILLIFTSCNRDGIELVHDGQTDYEIVFMGNATESQYKSAEILQRYLKEISGVELELVDESSQDLNKNKIYVGNIKGEDLKQQEIAIRTENKDLYILGGSDKATKYAVYEFLERYLNCRWYAPEVEKIPVSKIIDLPALDYVYTPDITTRTVHSRLFYDNPDYAEQQKVTQESFPTYVPSARVHTFHKFLPEEKFYKSHPEYFALRGDQRLPTQLCLTNPEVLAIVKDSVASLFEQYPQSKVISVSQDDNRQHCQCDNCSKIDEEEGSASGTMIRFVNEVAANFPDKMISTLAYQYTRKPCKTKPLENVLITLTSIECDRSAPIEEKCADFANDLVGWGKLTQNIRIWDYTTQFTNFFAPFPNIHTLQPNIQLFRDNNAKWVFEQHSNNPSELFELRSYITAKLLWNPDQNFDALLTDFASGYYEEAGIYIKEYIDEIHAKLMEDKDFFLFLYGDPSEAFSSYLSPEMLSKYSQLFDDAEKAVAKKPEILARVKVARLGVDFAELEASRKNFTDRYRLLIPNDEGKKIINPLVTTLLDNFKAITAKNNITLMNEMGFTVTEYLANYMSALEVIRMPNVAMGKKVVTITKPKKYAKEDPMALTDGALGGSSFYANWLGYEGNDMEVVVDLGEPMDINTISLAFLQVTNHVVFFPEKVTYSGSLDNEHFENFGTINNPFPLTKDSKVNDIQFFKLNFEKRNTRYIKVRATNKKTPYWHHAAGLPSWIFADEIIIN